MPVNQNVFIHETDRAAMQALKAIPGFTQVMKTFMNQWSEKLMYIENMATNIRISEEQLPKYREMLVPICEKLGIEVPDLFLKLDVVPNAWTSGDTRPFIVMTTGLLDTMPEELIPTVLAHECGHIACHHVLYRTMGTWILNGALTLIPLGGIAILPLINAFTHWMRCSELSADRAAVLCDGTPERVIEMCMRFAGFGSHDGNAMNIDAFMKQAEEYRKLVDGSTMNKTLEFMRFSRATHPINAVRASECREWALSDDYRRAVQYFEAYGRHETPAELPLSWNEKSFAGKNVLEAEKELQEFGFTNISRRESSEKSFFTKDGDVLSARIRGRSSLREGEWVPADAEIELNFYSSAAQRSVRREETGLIRLNHSHRWYVGRDVSEAENELKLLGFENVTREPVRDVTAASVSDIGKIITMTVDRDPLFTAGSEVSADAEINILYHEEAGSL